MRVSLHTIAQYIDFDLPPVDDLVARINAQLGGVEEVIHFAPKYKDVLIVRVVECDKHPNADRLSVCKIDDGSGELVQVVCGAPNVHANMFAAWLPPDSIVPSTYGTADEFTLGVRELRGVMSHGMLAAGDELGINSDHSGIIEIDPNEWKPSGIEIVPGARFAKVYGLDDTIIDIENKMFTHRPDLFGQIGVAREIAGILGHTFTSPDWYSTLPKFSFAEGLELTVENNASEKVPRFMAVAMRNVEVKPSPLWLQIELMRLGSKAINNIVDVTNYVMLLTAQPVHAYDYDKLRGKALRARMANEGEKITLLNGKTYELGGDDIVIADGEAAVGLAGIMGGAQSEVSPETKNIVLEVATFDMYALRKTSMRHGIFTDALTRFNKGQSPFQNDHVLNLLMMSIQDVSPATQASPVYDEGSYNDDRRFVSGEGIPEMHALTPHSITSKFINDRLGLDLPSETISRLLENVEFKVSIDSKGLDVHEPFWRTDIVDPEDIVEEVGRLYGFDKLPLELPIRSARPAQLNKTRTLADQIRKTLARAGANEVLTYSFVHERMIAAAQQQMENAYRLSNALSPDLQYYRLSLTPSLLDKIHVNSKNGYDEFALFEIGKSHGKEAGHDEEGLPAEGEQLAFVYASSVPKQGAAFYQAKTFLEFLAAQLESAFRYEQLGEDSSASVASPFEPRRSAIVLDKKTGLNIGIIGEYKQAVSRNFKLPEYAAGFELDLKNLLTSRGDSVPKYEPLSRYPSVERDVNLQVATELSYEKIFTALEESLKDFELQSTITPVSSYQAKSQKTKNITFRIKLTPHDKTLTSDEANTVIREAAEKLETSIDSKVV